jgi:hypothetical protein
LFTKYIRIVGIDPSSVISGVSGLPFLLDSQADFNTVRCQIGWKSVVGDRWTGKDTVRIPIGWERPGGSYNYSDFLFC